MERLREKTELLTAIPDELLAMEILAKKVDVKTLGKFSCISKWWNKTLYRQEFIDTRRRHYRQSTRLLFADSYGRRPLVFRPERLSFSTMSNVFCDGNVKITFLGKFSKFMVGSISGLRALSVCHDLVCVESVIRKHVIVFNPWTGQFVEFPIIQSNINEVDVMEYHASLEIDHGVFGYLGSMRKYVMVNLTDECKYHNHFSITNMFRRCQCRVVVRKISFNHTNNSSSKKWKWEKMKDVCPCRVRRGVFVDRFVFWLIKDTTPMVDFLEFRRENNQLIVSLDVEKEEFGIINCPKTPYWESHLNLNCLSITLIDLNGTLCLTDHETMCKSTPVFELWALKHELGQWEMKYNVRLDNVGMQLKGLPLACHESSLDGELIFKSRQCGTWYIYNPKTN